MEDRLVQLLKSEGINPTRFAERIGVQRSSMSHILSGRNKPSFDFIVKILNSFPAVNPDWLLRGKGSMYKNDIPIQPSLFDVLKTSSDIANEQKSVDGNSGINNTDNQEFNEKSFQGTPLEGRDLHEKEIHRNRKISNIIIFYTDKTFSDFLPNT